jgi:Papain-like cysteine protease AvrRpt2
MIKQATGFVIGPPPPPRPGRHQLPDRIVQHQTEWCWAACLAALGQFFTGTPLGQCRVAELVLGFEPNECCSRRESCNVPRDPDKIDEALLLIGLTSDAPTGALDFGPLQQALRQGPVAVGLTRTGGGHMLLAVGAAQIGGVDRVDIRDPRLAVASMEYQLLRSGHTLGVWSHTWSNIRTA